MNSTFNMLFIAPPAHWIGLAMGFFGGFGVWGSLEWLGVSLDEVGVLRLCEVQCSMSMMTS